jgi:hypothetical protein
MATLAPASPSYCNFRIGFVAVALALLVVPVIAMQFTAEVNWGPGDFVVMGGLLAALYAGVELSLRASRTRLGRVLAMLACLFAVLTVWAELAVGIFD